MAAPSEAPTVRPMSRSRAEKLGKAWASGAADEGQIAEIKQYVSGHVEPMLSVQAKLYEMGLNPTARLKTETTLREKLTRSTALGNVQDLAGVRVVEEMTTDDQDRLVESIKATWPDAKVIDRRAHPSSGYRAVHVVVHEHGH